VTHTVSSRRATSASIIPGAEPFCFPADGPLGCLLIHGFTGAPSEMRALGAHLQTQGISALGIRLPGHGTTLRDMERYGRAAWIRAAERGLELLLKTCERVVIIGMSMGGTIGLNLAARTDDPRIIGVVAMGTPVRLADWHYRPRELGQMLQRWREWGSPDIMDRAAWDTHIGYRSASPRSTIQLVRLVHETYVLLPEVTQPLLVLHSPHDHTVPPSNVHWLLDRVGSRERQIVWMQGSHHVITVDHEADRVAEVVVAFIQRLEARV
jgi:carboxylesterase